MRAKLDMGKAWNDATALLSRNKDVVWIMAGVFFFLPTAIVGMFAPQAEPAPPPTGATPEQIISLMSEQLSTQYAQVWWIMILAGIAQAIGVLAMLTLLTDRGRPTVGEAVKTGAVGVVSYLVAQIIFFLGLALVLGIVLGGGFAANMALGAVLIVPAMILLVYASIKISLLAPVIAIEKQLNPLAALSRSWQLTKGNSLMIFAFYILLFLVIFVISLIAGLLLNLFAAMGDSVGTIVLALGQGLITMAYTSVIVAVMASIYYQLSGNIGSASDVFE